MPNRLVSFTVIDVAVDGRSFTYIIGHHSKDGWIEEEFTAVVGQPIILKKADVPESQH